VSETDSFRLGWFQVLLRESLVGAPTRLFSAAHSELTKGFKTGYLEPTRARSTVTLQGISYVKGKLPIEPQHFHRAIDRIDVHEPNGAGR
jgi:hypothetical protein